MVQVQAVKVLLDEIFRTLRQAQTNLTDVDLAAIPALPTHNQTILDSLLSVWENTAFLGVLLLLLPPPPRPPPAARGLHVRAA